MSAFFSPPRSHRLGLALFAALVASGGQLRAQAPVPEAAPAPGAVPIPGVQRPGAVPQAGDNGAVPVIKTTGTNKTVALKFNAAPLDQVLQFYSDLTGRTPLVAPGVSATVTLRSQTDLTIPEAMQAVKTVLAMNNVALVEMPGAKFVKVVPVASVQQEGLPIQSNTWQQVVHEENDELISEIIGLRYIDPAEAQKAISGLIHTYGKILPLERINSLLIADTTININRIKDVLNQIDQPIELKEKLNILPIRHAKASDIKARLDEIIADQKDKDKQGTVRSLRQTGAPGVETTPTIPGVIRAPRPVTAAAGTEAAPEEGQMIRGNVRIIADDRTGVLIIITRVENVPFLEQIVAALDVATSPDVTVKVLRLEFANAEDVASMLNALIGAASVPRKDAAPKTSSTSRTVEASKTGEAAKTPEPEPVRSSQLQEFIEQQRQAASSRSPEAKTKIGQLSSENIKILSDKRSNALIIMASKGDMAALMGLIKDMDIQLSQVLIEAVILQVSLGDTVERGVDWVQRSMIAYDKEKSGRDPIFSFAGGGGGGKTVPRDATTLTSSDSIAAGGGLTYYFTHFGLNLDAVIKWSATDTRTKLLSSPVILTVDNEEAKIDVSQELYFYKGQTPTSVGGTIAYVPNVEARKVGLNLVVTPRINQKKFVVMQINQKLENQSGTQVIAGQGEWPVISSREMSASIAVRSGETIVLGGLIEKGDTRTRTKIPILGSIPILGALFQYSKTDIPRTEIVVFITPHVLDTPEEIEAESERRKQASSGKDMWEKGGWSDSKLAEPPKGRIRRWWQNLLK